MITPDRQQKMLTCLRELLASVAAGDTEELVIFSFSKDSMHVHTACTSSLLENISDTIDGVCEVHAENAATTGGLPPHEVH